MLKFTDEHEWLKLDGDVATVRITAHAAGNSATWCSWDCRRSAVR